MKDRVPPALVLTLERDYIGLQFLFAAGGTSMDESAPRTVATARAVVYAFGPFRLDSVKRLLLRDERVVPVSPRALDALLVLVENRARTVEKDDLLRAVWPGTAVEDNSLAQCVSTLRRVLGETASEHRYLVTIPGRGYRFVAPVREVTSEDAPPGEPVGLTAGDGCPSDAPREAVGRWAGPRRRAALAASTAALAAIAAAAALAAGRSRIEVADAFDHDVEAYRHYFLGTECEYEGGNPYACREHFQRALELDSTFALAQFRLAVASEDEGEAPASEQRAAFDTALRNVGRFPARERLMMLAWKAHLDDDDQSALATYLKLGADYPENAPVAYAIGEFYLHQLRDRRSALPWFERTLALDPGQVQAFAHLTDGLDVDGRRRDEFLRTVSRFAEQHPGPSAWRQLSVAYAGAGRLGAALAWMQRAAAAGSDDAREELAELRLFAGDYPAAEAEYRRLLAAPAYHREATMGLAAVRAYQGRRAEAMRLLESLVRSAPSVRAHLARLLYVMGEGRADVMRAEAARLRELSPHDTYPFQAANLAYAGDLDGAASLARDLVPGDHHEKVYRAVVQWRTGDASGAAERLNEILESPSEGSWRLLWFHAEALFDAGRFAEAADALRRFGETFEVGYPGFRIQRSWSYPRSLFLLARCHEALGHVEEARAAVDRLIAMWNDADPDLPLLLEARVLRARVAAR